MSKPYNLTYWHLAPLPSIQTGCMHWQMYIEMESLTSGYVLKYWYDFTRSRILRCVPTGIIHDAIPWYYSNHLAKSPHLSISHKLNHIFIRIINLKGTKTHTATALRKVIEEQRSGYLIKIKITGLVNKICNFSLWVQRCCPDNGLSCTIFSKYLHIKMPSKLCGTPYESNCRALYTLFAFCPWSPSLYTLFAIGPWSP